MLDKLKVWVYTHISELELLTFVILFLFGIYVIYLTA